MSMKHSRETTGKNVIEDMWKNYEVSIEDNLLDHFKSFQ